jgi:D-amino-acid dehydrogenase
VPSPDVVVVGGGAIGVTVAYELARNGASVRLLERDAIGAPSSASVGNAGLICPSHAAPLPSPRALREGLLWAFRPDGPLQIRPQPSLAPWLLRFALAARPAQVRRGEELLRELSLRSLALHAGLAASGLETGFVRRGILNVYETEKLFAHGAAEARRSVDRGLGAEVLDATEARSLEPALAGQLAGAVHYPREAHCDPGRYVAAVGEAAASLGAELTAGATVTAIRKRGRRVEGVETAGGLVPAGEVVLAAGAWSGRLARGLSLRLPLQPAKGYHLELAAAAASPDRPVFLQESRVVATPLEGRLRLAGTLQLAGFDEVVDRRRAESLRAAAVRVLPAVGGLQVARTWAGFRPCASDGLPIVGRPAPWENLCLATAHSMLGLTLAPITAEIVGRLVLGREPPADIAALGPDRFVRLGGR